MARAPREIIAAVTAAIVAGGATDAAAQPAEPAPQPAGPAPQASAEPAPPPPPPPPPPDPTWGGPRPAASAGELDPRQDLAPGDKREAQDYDGRPDETTAAEDALWIPRVIFFPAYLVTEYLVRVPLGALTIAIEENDVINEVLSFFTFGPNNNIGIIPTGFVDFGFRPSVGVFFFYDDFIAPGNDLRASFGFGGIRFWKLGLADRIPLETPVGTERARSYIQLEADYLARADLLFWGIGPRTLDADQSGYSITTYGGGGRVHVEPWRGTFFEGWVTGRWNRAGAGECADSTVVVEPEADGDILRGCDPPTLRRKLLDQRDDILAGDVEVPPGYGRPYATVKSGVRVVLDSRPKRPAPGTGIAFDASAEHASEIKEPAIGSWINYGATLAGFIDLTGKQRVLSLALTARFLNPIDDYEVPFTEYIGVKKNEDIPDAELMRGFRPGRLVGRSATAATLEYRWPIWAFLDGTMQAAVGNVWENEHLEDFDPKLLRFSFIGGIRSPNHRDHSFNLLVGVGTETFDQGADPSSVRFLFGGTTGF
jgi:hypothetical protein